MSLVMFIGVTLFVVRAASGCDDKKSAADCCGLEDDTTKLKDMPNDPKPAVQKPTAKAGATNKGAGIKAKPDVFLPASKSAPLPVFELKAPGLGKPNKVRRPSLNVVPQQQAAPNR